MEHENHPEPCPPSSPLNSDTKYETATFQESNPGLASQNGDLLETQYTLCHHVSTLCYNVGWILEYCPGLSYVMIEFDKYFNSRVV